MKQRNELSTYTRILEAAAELIWERSFQATSVEDLCQRADAKKGSFYHFFPSKTELAIAAIENSWQRIKETVFEPVFSSDESGLTQLQHLVEKSLEFQTKLAAERGSFLGCPFGNLGQEMARQDENLREALQNIFEQHCAYIENALNKAEQASEIPPGDNRQRATNIFALLEGAMLLAKVSNDAQVYRNVTSTVKLMALH